MTARRRRAQPPSGRFSGRTRSSLRHITMVPGPSASRSRAEWATSRAGQDRRPAIHPIQQIRSRSSSRDRYPGGGQGTAGHHRHRPALRQGRGLQPQPVPAEIPPRVGPPGAEAQRLDKPVGGHAASVVRDGHRRVEPAELDQDLHPGHTSHDAVVDDVRDRGRKVIADVAEQFSQPGRGRSDGRWTFQRGHAVHLLVPLTTPPRSHRSRGCRGLTGPARRSPRADRPQLLEMVVCRYEGAHVPTHGPRSSPYAQAECLSPGHVPHCVPIFSCHQSRLFFGQNAVVGTGMPETAVNEHSYLCCGERDVGPSWEARGWLILKSQPAVVSSRRSRNFRAGRRSVASVASERTPFALSGGEHAAVHVAIHAHLSTARCHVPVSQARHGALARCIWRGCPAGHPDRGPGWLR